jgi:hypothetical protein
MIVMAGKGVYITQISTDPAHYLQYPKCLTSFFWGILRGQVKASSPILATDAKTFMG